MGYGYPIDYGIRPVGEGQRVGFHSRKYRRGNSMTKRKAVISADELECQDSPVLAVLKYYGSPLTREEYLAVSYLGGVDSEEEIPDAVEETFPEQFRRATLLKTPPVSEKLQ
jgi:hypothetical protein